MGFNVVKFKDVVLDSVTDEANKATRWSESFWLGRLQTAVNRMTTVGRTLMTYRTWNLASSIVGVLLFDGKIVGIETEGYVFKSKKVSSTRTRNKFTYYKEKQNPIYSYNFTGGGERPWKYAEENNLGKKTGREWADYAAEKLLERERGTKGYKICFAIGMPYAWVGRGRMLERSTRIIRTVAEQVLGSNSFKMISIDYGMTTF